MDGLDVQRDLNPCIADAESHAVIWQRGAGLTVVLLKAGGILDAPVRIIVSEGTNARTAGEVEERRVVAGVDDGNRLPGAGAHDPAG